MPPTAAPVWLVEAVMGSIESDLKRMFAVYLLGSGAGLMGQPCGGLRRAMDEGGPFFPNCFCSAGPAEPGALSIPSFPTASLCAGCGLPLSRHLGMQGPGGQGQAFPSLS